jgi:hypothetical protein
MPGSAPVGSRRQDTWEAHNPEVTGSNPVPATKPKEAAGQRPAASFTSARSGPDETETANGLQTEQDEDRVPMSGYSPTHRSGHMPDTIQKSSRLPQQRRKVGTSLRVVTMAELRFRHARPARELPTRDSRSLRPWPVGSFSWRAVASLVAGSPVLMALVSHPPRPWTMGLGVEMVAVVATPFASRRDAAL